MKIIVVGVGKIGSTLVEKLVLDGYDVVVVDTDVNKVNDCVNRFDANGIVGEALSRSVLIEAGVSDADFLISATSYDEVNILCAVLGKKLGAKHVLARVREPRYFSEMGNLTEELGLDEIFNPELNSAMDILQVIKFPSAKSVESFAEGKALMVEFGIEKDNPIIGKALMDISKEIGFNVLFAIVKRNNELIIPRGDFVINENDTAYIIATETELTAFCKKLKMFKPRGRSVCIIGGGKIAYYLAKELEKIGVSIKIIEIDKERCKFLSGELENAMVLCADGTESNVLKEEDIKDCDAVITLTGIDEENVIISLFAIQEKVDTVITKINRRSIGEMVNALGLKTIINPKTSITNYILRFIREHLAETEGGINTLYKLSDKIEALEFTVKEDFEGLSTPLMNLKIKKDVLIGGVVRNNEYIFPRGETEFNAGDRVIVITGAKRINQLSDILK